MPRKHARPAEKKAAARRKAKMAAKAKPQRRVGIIAHRPPSCAALATAAAISFRMRRDPEIDRALGKNIEELYEP